MELKKSIYLEFKGHKTWMHSTKYAPLILGLICVIILPLLLFIPHGSRYIPIDSTPNLEIENNPILFSTLIIILSISLILLRLNHRKTGVTLTLDDHHLELSSTRSTQLFKFEEIVSLEIQDNKLIWVKTDCEYFKLSFNDDQDLDPLFNHFSCLSKSGKINLLTSQS